MSYDIGLYDKTFLQKAVAEDLGDWTGAPEIASDVREALESILRQLGYKLESDTPQCREWIHPNEQWGLQVSIFNSEIAFTIPYWDDCTNAIIEASELAQDFADKHALGYHDPQA